MAALVRRLGLRRARAAVVAGALVLLLAGAGLGTLLVSPRAAHYAPGLVDEARTVVVAGDADLDGLPDAVENRLGSDPASAETLGGGIPDGWLVHWLGDAIDWSDPGLLNRSALLAPPDALPEALREPGTIEYPTLAELYAHEKDARSDGLKGAWWLEHPGLDPTQWDNDGDGIADAWLLSHGVDPVGAQASKPAPGDASMTLREKYQHGLDPSRDDSDGDGLLDREELAGAATLGGHDVKFPPSDPRRASSAQDGVADGYAAWLGLDPRDPSAAARTWLPGGLSALEGYRATLVHCERAAGAAGGAGGSASSSSSSSASSTRSPALSVLGTGACKLRAALSTGPVADPRKADSNGDGVPEAWAVREPSGLVDPLADARKQVVATSADWDRSTWTPARTFGLVVDADNPAPPKPYQVTAADLYLYERPSNWTEQVDGPWPFGLPVRPEPGAGGLPPAVALRGWNLTLDLSRGRNATTQPDPAQQTVIHAAANPSRADSDGDGLTDAQEYFGLRPGRDVQYPRTNALDPDTDGDGLSDRDEDRYGTHPLRQDTGGSFLTDGEKVAYWTERFDNATRAFATDFLKASQDYSWLAPAGDPSTQLARLLPIGDPGSGGGDLDGDGVPNVLDPDSDGDGLADGAELHPDTFLPDPGSFLHPPTDPSRIDTDGDSLLDGWEVHWSRDGDLNCHSCESLPDNGEILGDPKWPINPSRMLSWDRLSAEVRTDADVDLSGERSLSVKGATRDFSNGVARTYDLNPYHSDDNGDGIPNMYAIEWGIRNVPGYAQAAAPEWARTAASRLSNDLATRGFPDEVKRVGTAIAIDPKAKLSTGAEDIGPSSNLLGLFTDRAKGTWVYTALPACDGTSTLSTLPATGPRRERDYGSDGDRPADRTGLKALVPGQCWAWHPLTLGDDADGGRNPWLHTGMAPGQQIPDAWLAFYGKSADKSGALQSSLDANCKPKPEDDGHDCVTLAVAYAHGLDPRVSDTDQGSVPDWEELKIGLDPLDAHDDHGEEDWDGDGLPNFVEFGIGTSRLDADSDHDGLLDGDLAGARYRVPGYDQLGATDGSHNPDRADGSLGFFDASNGDGNLCIPHGRDDVEVPNMGHRPGGGALTYGQLRAGLLAGGALSQANSSRCPTDTAGVHGDLFLREAILLHSVNRTSGAGVGSDSLKLSTAGDGVPDGWKVYWAQRHGDALLVREALSPDRSGRVADNPDGFDPDNDFASTAGEYGLADGDARDSRPPGWTESRDGVWWGGSDPGTLDSDGDRAWFNRTLDAADRDDGDLDNDGIPDSEDPFPADHANRASSGVVRWDGTRYKTDFTRLWTELAARSTSSLRDGDGDRVPDFLDRARVAVTASAPQPATVTKGQAFTVTGAVVLAEPQDGSGAPPGVGGATVRLVASDGVTDALVGYGFTDSAGGFTITGTFADAVGGPNVPPGGASVGGRYAASGRPALDGSAGLDFKPGPLKVRVEVEANDAALQRLTFNGLDSAAARKDLPYNMPRAHGPPARLDAVALSGGAPDRGTATIRHSTPAVFHAISGESPLTLKDTLLLSLQASPQQVLLGDLFNATGLLTDAANHPLAGRTVVLHLDQGARDVALPSATTGEDGSFRANNVSTGGWAPGLLSVRADVDIGGSTAPASATAPVTVIEATRWSAAVVQGATCGVALCPDGSRIVALPGDAPRVSAVLRDHRGQPVPDRAVGATLTDASGTARSLGALRTAADGSVLVTLPAFKEDGAPETRTLKLVQAGSASGQDDPFELFVEPRFATRITILHGSGATAPAGTPVNVTGRLERLDGEPVFSPAAQIGVRFVPGGTAVVVGTDHDGRFNVTVQEDEPGLRSLLVSYLGSSDPDLRFLRPSPPAYANVTHAFPVRLALDPVAGLRGEPVVVTGALARLPAGGYPQLKPLPPAQQPFLCQVNLGSRRALEDDAFYLAFRPEAPEAGAHLQDGDLRLVPPEGRSPGSAIGEADDAEKGQPFAAACTAAAFRTAAGPSAARPLVLLDTGSRDALANGPAGAAEGPGAGDVRLTDGARPAGTLVLAGDADAAAAPPAAEAAWSLLFQDADRSGVFTPGTGDGLVLSQAAPTGGPQAPGDVLLGPVAALGTTVEPGTPLPAAPVEVAWRGNGSAWVTATTGPDGRFTATLPARDGPGEAAFEARFAGDATHLPDAVAANATIRPRNTLSLTLDRLAFGPDGAVLDPKPWGQATADSGGVLTGLPVDLTLTAPDGSVRRQAATTDANGTFAGAATPDAFALPGLWTVAVRGGAANATARVPVVHQARIAVDLAPTEAAAGEPVDLAGHVDGPLPGVEVHVTLAVDGGAIANFLAWTGRGWTARVAMPALGDAPATIALSGDGGDGVEVLGAEAAVSPIHPIKATLQDTLGEDGRRTLLVVATDAGGRPPPAGLEVVLVEGDGDGALSHVVRLDAEGRGTLDLGFSAEPVRAVALRDPALRLASVSSESIGHRIATTTTPTAWVPSVAAGAAALGILLLGGWALWAAARRRRMRAGFLRAHTLLLGGKPARQAIRDLYAHILRVLGEAGYEPDAADTVRAIATRATAEFRLPPEPMYDLTAICERVLYSRHEPTPAERDVAIRSAAAIADRLSVPFFVRRTVRA
jgi:hypothetical protein